MDTNILIAGLVTGITMGLIPWSIVMKNVLYWLTCAGLVFMIVLHVFLFPLHLVAYACGYLYAGFRNAFVAGMRKFG